MKRRLSYSSSVANMSHLPLDAGCNNGIATSDGALGQQLHQSVEVKNSTAGGKSTAVARRPLRQRVICGRCSRPSSMSWIAVIGLVLVSRASLFTVAGSPASASDPPPTSRLCAPPESARAYVTTLADEETVGQGLSVRVLAQSLRSAGAKGDIIVLVPLDRSHGKTVDSFRRDGLTVHTVPRGLQTAGGDIASDDLMTKIFLWSLVAYDRVVYLDPRSLIQKNPDALFACEGFCAASAVSVTSDVLAIAPSAVSNSENATAEMTSGTVEQVDGEIRGPSWQPSTSVMVLEPSMEVHNAMLKKLMKTTSVGSSLEAQAFVSAFLEAGDRCTPFEGIGGVGHWSGQGAHSQRFKGDDEGNGWGVGVNDGSNRFDTLSRGGANRGVQSSALKNAFEPLVFLNGAHMPSCTKGRPRTPAGVCQRLPYTYAAPAADFAEKQQEGAHGIKRNEVTEPHIIHFADEDVPWKRLAYLHKPLFWKWNKIREQLQNPYGQFFSPWLLFLIPCVVLAFARVYYKIAGYSSHRVPSIAQESHSKKRGVSICSQGHESTHAPLAIVPAGNVSIDPDIRTLVVTLTHPNEKTMPSASEGVGRPLDLHPQYSKSVCLLLSLLVITFGLLWFRATRVLAREAVDASWHPFVSIAVYNAWLCCALVVGLYIMDYAYYVTITRACTLWKDALAVAMFVKAVHFLHSRRGFTWAVATGIGVISLGFGHGSRPEAIRRLTTRMQFRCITASCIVEAAVSLAMCSLGSGAHEVLSRRAQVVAGLAQMLFTALVYASVFGGCLLQAGMGRVGLACDRPSALDSCVEAPIADTGTSKAGIILEEANVNGESHHHRPSAVTKQSSPRAAAVLIWLKKLLGRRRVVVACLALLMLWLLSATLLPKTSGSRLELYGQVCLGGREGFVEAGGKRLSKVCGPEQGLLPVETDYYFEAFRQDKVCLQLAGGGFLTLGRVHIASTCTSENQFVFQQVKSSTSKSKIRPGSRDDLSSAPAVGAPDAGEYCVYNPTRGFYLSAKSIPQSSCGSHERWRLQPAPVVPGVARARAPKSRARSTLSMLLHPGFLSQGPLHTLYGYLRVITIILLARVVFTKLGSSRGGSAPSRGSENGGNGGSLKHRHSLGPRQKSRRHNRSRSGNKADAWFGDAGYAGDAEAGGGDYEEYGRGSQSAVGEGYRSLSESPMGPQRHFAWGLDVPMHEKENTLSSIGEGMRHQLRGASNVPMSLGTTTARSNWDDFLRKVFSALCVCCDATLLAGVWCLLPAHLAQALSALTQDHHSAIGQGLGKDSLSSDATDSMSRILGEGVIVFDPSVPKDDMGREDDVTSHDCENNSWWIMSVLLRWHLLLLLVAFCHLHGAAAISASAQSKGRDRRTGKRLSERVSLWGLRAGEQLAMRLRTGLGVLAMLCVLVTTTGAGLGGDASLFLGLHVHPCWTSCASAAGLDGSWAGVSPLLVFAILAAAAGVYIRAGATTRVRIGAAMCLVVVGGSIALAVGRAYLLLAVVAVGMEWGAWGMAGLLSCVCYQKPSLPKVHRDSSGSAASVEDSMGGRPSGGLAGARLRGREERRHSGGTGRWGQEGRRKRGGESGSASGRVGAVVGIGDVVV